MWEKSNSGEFEPLEKYHKNPITHSGSNVLGMKQVYGLFVQFTPAF
jgi:hypothetical protein